MQMGVQEYTMGHDMKNNSFELILFRKWPYGMNVEGQADYQSVIVVAPDRSLQKNEALRDERFAFGSIASTQWHFILARWIAEEGFIRIIHNSAFYLRAASWRTGMSCQI